MTNTQPVFDYSEAFSRNIGLLTEEEQAKLREFTIAIPGMGGVGGAYLIALVRQGFEKFKIADMDVYELKNFNRQYGANMSTIGRQKVHVMKEEALKINPNCCIETFDSGITPLNMYLFLDEVNIVVDALDAFEVDTRRTLYNESLKREIPIITAGPIGFGTASLIFMPGGPNFDEYFAIRDSTTYQKKVINFFAGLVPGLLQRRYLRGVNLNERRGPSSIGSISLCAGVVVIQVLKILLKKGTIHAVPYYQQFDVMRNKYVLGRMPFGNKNPIQQLKIKLARFFVKD